MIHIGTILNQKQFDIMQWDNIEVDFYLVMGYIQGFIYPFYNDYGGIEETEEGLDYAKPLGE
jgi:hypothetical protein